MTPSELGNLRAKARDMQADVHEVEAQIAAHEFRPENNERHYLTLAGSYRQMARDYRKMARDFA